MIRRVALHGLAVAVGLAALPTPTCAEQLSGMFVLGILSISAGPDDPLIHAISKRLLELGYVEGRGFRVEFRGAQGIVDRLQHLAQEPFNDKGVG